MTDLNGLYEYFSHRIPGELSEAWDNDGIMLRPASGSKEIHKVLLTLDVTEAAAQKAIDEGFDLIISHHPMIFRPLRSIASPKHIGLIKNDIAVFSFHTRLDRVEGGVNDALAAALGLTNVEKMSLGRVGELPAPMPTGEFVELIREELSCEELRLIERSGMVFRVALCGGDGKDFLEEAEAFGADTYLTGSMSYNSMVDASEGALNVIEAGHYETEFPVLYELEKMIYQYDPDIETEVFDNNPIVYM